MAKKPVDTAIVVSVGPLVDDTDFKSLETAVAYNAAGMSVDLFVESAGTITKTDLILTSGGDNDWTHKGNAVYELEITATQNDTEGTLWVVGIADGVLVFESPRYEIVPVKVYNSLIVGSDNLEVDQVQLGGSAQSSSDLKDFADEGYDPTTNKVEGVKLVDTTTTNTDQRGTDNALLASGYIAPDNAGISDNGIAIGNLNDLSTAEVTASVPNVVQIRQEMDDNSTKLDVPVSTRNSLAPDNAGIASAAQETTLNAVGVIVAGLPTAPQIDTELTSNHGAGTWQQGNSGPVDLNLDQSGVTVGSVSDGAKQSTLTTKASQASVDGIIATLSTLAVDTGIAVWSATCENGKSFAQLFRKLLSLSVLNWSKPVGETAHKGDDGTTERCKSTSTATTHIVTDVNLGPLGPE